MRCLLSFVRGGAATTANKRRCRTAALLGCLALAACGSSAAHAQNSPADREAKKLFAELIAFRSAAGQGQATQVADYIVKQLRAAGVPAEDVVELPLGETKALIVRVPG